MLFFFISLPWYAFRINRYFPFLIRKRFYWNSLYFDLKTLKNCLWHKEVMSLSFKSNYLHTPISNNYHELIHTKLSKQPTWLLLFCLNAMVCIWKTAYILVHQLILMLQSFLALWNLPYAPKIVGSLWQSS